MKPEQIHSGPRVRRASDNEFKRKCKETHKSPTLKTKQLITYCGGTILLHMANHPRDHVIIQSVSSYIDRISAVVTSTVIHNPPARIHLFNKTTEF